MTGCFIGVAHFVLRVATAQGSRVGQPYRRPPLPGGSPNHDRITQYVWNVVVVFSTYLPFGGKGDTLTLYNFSSLAFLTPVESFWTLVKMGTQKLLRCVLFIVLVC